VDDPVHAPLGLEAARALAKMAPDAGHSQHMTSHIFTAVGMWDDVVTANEEAIRVQNGMRVSRGQPPRHWGHYNFWLLYGLLQQGRQREAGELLRAAFDEATAAGAVPDDPLELDADRSQIGSLVQMWARYMIETRGKDAEIAAWTFNMGEAFDPKLTYRYVQSLRAAYSGYPSKAGEHLKAFRKLQAKLEKAILAMARQAPTDLLYLDRLSVMEQELQAMIAWAEEKPARAVEFADKASRLEGEMPFSFGPPFVDLPSAELLGELLLGAGRYDEAIEAYGIQLERTRRKALPLLGLGKAEQGSGNEAGAAFALAKLREVRKHADPELKEGL
jgi:tetratricopeptide (TPR) repeat protein